MDTSYVKSSNAKRFVIEDSITKVTSDGEPHEMMTMIAGLSGVLAAVVILTVLIFLVACKKSNKKHECDKCSETGSTSGASGKRSSTLSEGVLILDGQSKCSSIATIYECDGKGAICKTGRSVSSPIIHKCGNLQSNLNKAFEGSELSLQGSLDGAKKPKRTHWQDEVEKTQHETTIEIERY
uniref:Adenovirus E3 region protein CR2 n=1 Tax=Musca domestica TaxID=7370 RepID=T1PBL1_MUSDO